LSRLPIRVRLALAFAVAMAVVLTAIGAVLTARLGASLDEGVDESLEARSTELATGVARGDANAVTSAGGDSDERFVQLLDPNARVVAATRGLEGRALLSPRELAEVTSGETFELSAPGGLSGRFRVLPRRVDDGARILLVGGSLDDRDETVRSFLLLLLVVGPVALALVTLLGYALASAALRPVESMRREAEAISASEPGRRLTLPDSRDEVRRLGETLNEMLGRLQTALEREREFVADASHELRTPLALLTTELELALRSPRSTAELEDALRSAAAEADRLARLAEDLLLLARSDSGRLPTHPEPLRARALLERVARRLASLATARDRSVDIDAPDDLALVGDPLLLEQALGNLVENALRHGRGPVRLSAVRRGGTVELHVADEGAGFPGDFLPRAFDRFSRAADGRTGDGAGLGLTIAAAIAVAHWGSIEAENRAGGGADVWLTVPVAAAVAVA
jgi:signal transduction histidine kinase